MKWGVRRYQPYSSVPRKSGKSGKMVGAAKKANKVNKGKVSSSKSKQRGAKSNNKKDQYRPKKDSQQKLNDAQKEEIIRSGDIKKIVKYSNQLNNNEIRQAMDRVSLNDKLSAMDPSNRMKGKERLDKVFNVTKDATDKANTAIGAYNTFAKVYNSLSDEPLPVLDGTYRRKTDARVKKVLNNGTAEEVWAEVKKGTVGMDDWKKANNRFAQEKATHDAMERERTWKAQEAHRQEAERKEAARKQEAERREYEERMEREEEERRRRNMERESKFKLS